MINIKWLREKSDEVKKYLNKRKIKNYDEIMDIDLKFRELKFKSDQLLKEKNKKSKELRDLKTSEANSSSQFNSLEKDKSTINQEQKEAIDIDSKIQQIKIKELEIKELKMNLINIEDSLRIKISMLPNILQDEVPVGEGEDENKVIKTWGEKPSFNFKAKRHDYFKDYINSEMGAITSGAKFCVLKGTASELERALVNFMIDEHKERGFKELSVPFIVTKESMFGSGQLPKFEDDAFKIEGSDLYLIPTGEVPLVNLMKGRKIEKPIRTVSHTSCFRKEAGASGKENKGLIRLHQFSKVELVSATKPCDSESEHMFLLESAENILQKLGLHYRISLLCSGDTGDTSSKTYDIEVWMPGENLYREIASCSNCLDYQSRRIGLKTNEKEFAHTLNSSGLAIGRTIAAIIENYQDINGSVKLPEVLKKYIHSEKLI